MYVFILSVLTLTVISSLLILISDQDAHAMTKFFVRVNGSGSEGEQPITVEMDDGKNKFSWLVTLPKDEIFLFNYPNASISSSVFNGYDVNMTLPYDLPEGTVVTVCASGEIFGWHVFYGARDGKSCTVEMVRDNLVVAFL